MLFALWAVVLRRPPAVAAALGALPTGLERKDVAFLSWFGPLGVAAVYYATFVEQYERSHYGEIFGAATLAIALSVVSTPSPRRRRSAATPGAPR